MNRPQKSVITIIITANNICKIRLVKVCNPINQTKNGYDQNSNYYTFGCHDMKLSMKLC